MLFRRKSEEDRRIEMMLEQAKREEEQIQLRRRVQKLMSGYERRSPAADNANSGGMVSIRSSR